MACQTFSGVPTLGCCNVPPQVTSVNRYIAAIYARLWCARSGPCIPYKLAKFSQRTTSGNPAAYPEYNWDSESRAFPKNPSEQGLVFGGLSFVSSFTVAGAPVVMLSDTPTGFSLIATHTFQSGFPTPTVDFSFSFALSEPYEEAEIQADLLALYNDFTAADFAAPFIGGIQDFRRSWANGQIVPAGAFPQDNGLVPLCAPRQSTNQAFMNAWGRRKLDQIQPVSTEGIPGLSFPAVNVSRSMSKAIIQLAGVPPTQRPYCKFTFAGIDADCAGVIHCTSACEQGTLANPITIEGTALAAGTGVILEPGLTRCVCNPAP